MKKRYSVLFTVSLIASITIALHSPVVLLANAAQKADVAAQRDTVFKAKPLTARKQTVSELLKNGGNPPYGNAVKTYAALTAKNIQENEKLLSNVKVLPTQITDQIALSFRLSKDTNVSIKLMDALGNEVAVFLSQRLTAGDHDHLFAVANKLNKGYYFIRVTAGTEQPIIKRVEAL